MKQMKLLLVFLLASALLLVPGCGNSAAPEPMLIRQAGLGLWQVSPDGSWTFLSKDFSSVVADGVTYQLDQYQNTWRIRADGETIAQGGPPEAPEYDFLPTYPIPQLGTLIELEDWLYFVLMVENGTDHLCRVRTDGTGFAEYAAWNVRAYELLTAEGRVVLRVRGEDGNAYPGAFDPETQEITVLSDIPANISNRFFTDVDTVWWTSDDMETKKAVQCNVPVTGGETELLDMEYVSFVGGGNLLIGSKGEIQVMDMDSGKTDVYTLPFDDNPDVIDAKNWGAVIVESLINGQNYWLLSYDTGTWTPLALE